jgi:ATP-dependent helicase/nuclease subunit B
MGYEIGSNNDMRSSDELMFVKNAFSAPTKRLYLLASESSLTGEKVAPSLPYRRTALMFGITPHKFVANDLSYLCGSPRSAATHIRSISDVSKKASIQKAVGEHIPAVMELSDASVFEETVRISPELIHSLLGDSIYISPSSLEKYVKCPFSYYASYVLSLREPASGSFRANNFGSFVHYVLEHLIRYAVPSSPDEKLPNMEQIEAKTDEIIDAYIKKIAPDETINTKRMTHLYKKLKRLCLLLIDNVCKEFTDSSFRPAFFELHTNGNDGNPAPIEIPLDNGNKVILRGYIDRVDIWKNKDKVYVRIVDYKTGSKSFDLNDVAVGLNTQMLLYLFSICRNPGTKLCKAAELDESCSPIPAGIVYLSSAISPIKLNDYELTEEQILGIAENNFSRSGLVLNDEDVLGAFSASASNSLLLGVTKKDGKYSGKALIDRNGFDTLHRQILDTLAEIGNKIYDGIADCTPISYGGSDPCKYCTAKPICRNNVFSKGGY